MSDRCLGVCGASDAEECPTPDVCRVVESLRCDLERAEKERNEARMANVCDACLGKPLPAGGLCVCGGTGSMSDAARFLRERVVKLTRERDEARANLVTLLDHDSDAHDDHLIDCFRRGCVTSKSVLKAALDRAEQAEKERDALRAEVERVGEDRDRLLVEGERMVMHLAKERDEARAEARAQNRACAEEMCKREGMQKNWDAIIRGTKDAHERAERAERERDEARARCDTLRELADAAAHESGLYARRMGEAQEARDRVTRERDEARAAHELEKQAHERRFQRETRLIQERDEAREEVETWVKTYETTHADVLRLAKERDEYRALYEAVSGTSKRDIAERQRELCVKTAERFGWLEDEVRSIRLTPLVTDEACGTCDFCRDGQGCRCVAEREVGS